MGLAVLAQISTGVAFAESFGVAGHLGGTPNVLVAHAGYLYLGSGPELAVLDPATANSDMRVGYIVFHDMVQDIALTPDGPYAGVAAQSAGFWLVDLRQPTSPRAVTFLETPALGVAIAGHYAYTAGDTRLQIVDIAQPEYASLAGVMEVPGSAQKVKVYGDHAYVAQNVCRDGTCYAGLLVVDVSDPTTPREVGMVDPTGGAGIEDIVAVDNTIYIATGSDGLCVINAANPTLPVETEAINTPGTAWAVAVANDLVYVADGLGGLFLLRQEH